MSTKFLSPGWRMPRNANQSKSSNYSLDFGGSNQYISSSPTLSGLTDVTVSCWAKFENINNNDFQYVLIAYNTSQSGSYRVGIGMIKSDYSTVSDRYKLYTIDGSNLNISSFVVSQDVWYNIVVTQSGTVRKLFVNGDLISTFTGVPSLNLGNNLEIGRFSNNNHYFPGKINSVSIFDYALSSSQVTTLWGGGTSVSNPMALPSSPIAYYPLGGSAGAFQTPVNNNDKWLIENNAIGDYVFDFEQSSSQNIDIGSSTLFDSTSAFSFSTWCKLESYDNSFPAFIRLKTDQSTGFIMGFSNSATYYGVWFGSSSNFLTARTAGDISADLLGVWKHISLVYDGVDRTAISSYSLYINGVPQSLVSSGSFGATPNTNLIGQGNTASTFWDGEISNTQIWNTNLSSSEITTLYNYGSPIRTLASIPQNSNLKAWYKLDASEVYNSSTTEWSIDNNQNPSAYASSLDFDSASSDAITLGNTIGNGFTQITCSIWANISTSGLTQSSYRNFLVKFPSGSLATPFELRSNNGNRTDSYNNKLFFRINTNTGAYGFTDTGFEFTEANKWHHLVGTYDGSNVKLFVDGVEYYSISANGTLNSNNDNALIGYHSSGNFNGKLSNASIWNAALTTTQITELYNNGTPSNLSSHSATSNLVSWYKLNNTTTGIEDSKGSNNGTNNGATEYTGFVNTLVGDSSGMSQANLVQSDLQTVAPYSKYALDFDGTDDYIDLGTDSSLDVFGGDFSVSLWFKHTMSSGSARAIIEIGATTYSANMAITLGLSSNTGVGFAVDNNWNYNAGSGYNDGNWHHMVATRKSTTYKIYVDNTEISFSSGSYAYLTENTIGKGKFGGNFNGSISNVSVWNTALTSAQVTGIYNEGLPSDLNSHSAYSNLVSWWQLGENSSFNGNDWIVADEIGSNNGESDGMGVDALVNGVGTTANGVSSGMSEGNLVGDAPYSTANAISSGMSVVSRVTDVAPSPPPLLLDTYTGSQAAYSLRRLSNSYTGNLIRVTKKVSNVISTTDIGYNSSNELDTTALATFASGADNGEVRVDIWYDQSGNSNNLTHNTYSQLPKIYDGGSLITENSKPALTVNRSRLITTGTPISSQQSSIFYVTKVSSGTLAYDRLWVIGTSSSGYFTQIGAVATPQTIVSFYNGTSSSGGDLNSQRLITFYNDSTTQYLRQDSVQVDSDSKTPSSYGSKDISLFSDTNIGKGFVGVFQEFIFYPTEQSSNLTGIETNIKNYHGI